MNPSHTPDVDQETIKRAGDVLEFLAKAVGLAAVLAGFVRWAWKPYVEWRRDRMAHLMRDIMKDELSQLKALIEREDGCADRMDRAVEQITELFSEHDMLLDVVYDNRDRIDETNGLLDAVGLANDRRVPQKEDVVRMFNELDERRKARRRKLSPGLQT